MTSAQIWALISSIFALTAGLFNMFVRLWIRKNYHRAGAMGIIAFHRTPWLVYIGHMCFVYAAAWAVIAFDWLGDLGWTRQDWSEIITPLSALTFLTVWVSLPLSLMISTITAAHTNDEDGS